MIFGAAWAQMLNYVITIAISAYFVPHYLSIFWEPLKTNPWDIIVGSVVIVLLVARQHRRRSRRRRGSTSSLAVLDFATQLLLVLLGFFLVFSPSILIDNVTGGSTPTWSNFALAVPVAMIAYTGIETVSNLAEEARDPARNIPRAIPGSRSRSSPSTSRSPRSRSRRCRCSRSGGETRRCSRCRRTRAASRTIPCSALVENLGMPGSRSRVRKVYVGVLAATILFIATNAGVIGASRITYAMATYRQLPEVFRRVHPRFKTPWLSLVFFAGIALDRVVLSGQGRLPRPDVRVRRDALVHDRAHRR